MRYISAVGIIWRIKEHWMVLQGSFSSWRKSGRAAAEASAEREKRRTWQAVSGSVGLVASWSWRGGREGKETERTRRRLAFYFSFFLLCLKTSGAVTSVLFPFWFFTSAVRELKNQKNQILDFIFLILYTDWALALYSNWSWCAVCLMAKETSVCCSCRKSKCQEEKKGDRAPIWFSSSVARGFEDRARLILLFLPSYFFLFDTFDDIHI